MTLISTIPMCRHDLASPSVIGKRTGIHEWAADTKALFDPDEFEQAYYRGKLPTPESLADFTAQIGWMRQHRASTSENSEHISKVIDARFDASNKPRGGESIFNPFRKGAVADRQRRWEAFDRALDPELGLPGKGIDDGKRHEHCAIAAWDYRAARKLAN